MFRGTVLRHPGLALLLLLAIALLAPKTPCVAADSRFLWEAGGTEIYSQDVLRTGDDGEDDFITSVRLTGALEVATRRSLTSFRYIPEYLRYARLTSLNHLDHRFGGTWRLQTGERSSLGVRQGFADTTRQSGFQDFAGTGGNVSEPVIGQSRRVTWDIEPQWILTPSPASTVSVQATYRVERYDRPELIDSEQAGVAFSSAGRVGRAHMLGGRLRGDAYRYNDDTGPIENVFDRFVNAQLVWTVTSPGRMNLEVAPGVYVGAGNGLDPATGPTLDLVGTWTWRRASLGGSYGLGYSSGGGVSTSDRSQHGDINYRYLWVSGYEFSAGVTYLRRGVVGERFADSLILSGQSAILGLSRKWRSGLGLTLTVSGLRQEEQVGNVLSYLEAAVGLTYVPQVPARAVVPSDPPPET